MSEPLNRSYYQHGEAAGSGEHVERLYKVLAFEIRCGFYDPAAVTMSWIQRWGKLHVNATDAALVLLEAHEDSCNAVNWSEVEYV